VQQPEPVTASQVASQLLLLVGAGAGVFGLDEADVLAAPADGLEVIGDLLHEQLAQIDVR
jgi:hypothetical protein